MREVVLDTETTGLDVVAGHRIVEIGCVELVNHVPTGQTFQRFLNPDRKNDREAFEVHGLSDNFLLRQMRFREIADDLMDFLADSPLIIHNAVFDLGFLNFELKQAGHPLIRGERVVDSLELARDMFPGKANSLDALMQRFEIDATARTRHGALLDAELLAQIYLELKGGRQQDLGFGPAADDQAVTVEEDAETTIRDARPHGPTAQEFAAHEAFLDNIPDPIWWRG